MRLVLSAGVGAWCAAWVVLAFSVVSGGLPSPSFPSLGTVALLGCVYPVVEEFLFREVPAALFPDRVGLAVGVATAVFVPLHMVASGSPLWSLVSVAPVGVAVGVLRVRCGFFAGVPAHVVYNLVVLTFASL